MRRLALLVVAASACAPSAGPDRGSPTAPDLIVPPMPSASAAPAPAHSAEPAAEPMGLSYEEALAQIAAESSGGAQGAHGKALSDAELTAPLRSATFIQECGAPESTKVTVKVLVRRGRATGVSVRATPHDDAVVRCVDAHVRAMRWPSSPYADSFTTTY